MHIHYNHVYYTLSKKCNRSISYTYTNTTNYIHIHANSLNIPQNILTHYLFLYNTISKGISLLTLSLGASMSRSTVTC